MESRTKRKIYKRWWFWVAVFIIFAVYSVVSDQNPTSNKAVSSSNSSQQTIPINSTDSQSTNSQPAKSSLDVSKINQYLSDNFKDTDWYRLIDHIEANGNSVDVYTTIYKDAEGKATAKHMVNVLYGNLKAQFPDLESVTIDIQNGNSVDPIESKSHY